MSLSSRPLFLVGALLLGVSTIASAELPQISDARIIQPPPGARVAAAYFTIHNNDTTPLTITGASSEEITNISLHLSSVVNDVARMEEQASITIEPGESLEFKQGSYHLMLMGIRDALTAGNDLPVVLDTSAGALPVMIPIMTAEDAASMGSAHSHSMSTTTLHNHDAMTKEHNPDAHESMDHKQ